MKKDELQETQHDAEQRRYREKAGQFIASEEAKELAKESGRRRTLEDNRLLLDEDDAKTELPR